MAFELASAYVELSQRGFGGVMGAIRGIGAGLVSMGPMALAAGGAIAAIGGAAGAAGLIGLAAEAETTAVQFETLLQSADKAQEHIQDLKDFGASTPFEFSGLANTSKTLLAFGVAQENIIPTMRVLGDISSSTGSDLNELATVFGKIRGQGKLTGETLDQLVERKVPIVSELAKSFNVAETEIRKMVSEGKIGFGDVQQALNNLTAEGGMMAGGMAAQSQTLAGLWSTFGDEMTGIMTDIAVALAEGFDLKGGVASLTSFASWFRENVVPGIVDAAKWLRVNVVDNVMDLVQNWDIYWGLAVEYAKLAWENIPAVIEAGLKTGANWFVWFSNSSVASLEFLRENGIDLIREFATNAVAIYGNLFDMAGKSAREFFDFLASGGTDAIELPQASDLFKGVKTEAHEELAAFATELAAKMPGAVAPQLRTMNDEIMDLLLELGERQSARSGGNVLFPEGMAVEGQKFGEKAGEEIAKAVDEKGFGKAFQTFGISSLADAMQGWQSDALKAAQESRDHLAKIAGAVTSNGLKVELAGGGTATVPLKAGYDAAAFKGFSETP